MPLPKDDPLNFEDKYTDRLTAARKLTGQDDAIDCKRKSSKYKHGRAHKILGL